METHGTIFHGKQVAVGLIVYVLACVAEGVGIRATARVFEVDPNTVLRWLVEAAEQLTAFSAYFLCEIHVKQLQLDELYAVLRAVHNGDLHAEEAIQYRVCGAPQPRHPAVRGGDRAPGEPALPGRSGFAGSVSPVSRLS